MRMLEGWENEKVKVPLSCETVEREASQKNVLSEDSI